MHILRTLHEYIEGNMAQDENVFTAINAFNVALRMQPNLYAFIQ